MASIFGFAIRHEDMSLFFYFCCCEKQKQNKTYLSGMLMPKDTLKMLQMQWKRQKKRFLSQIGGSYLSRGIVFGGLCFWECATNSVVLFQHQVLGKPAVPADSLANSQPMNSNSPQFKVFSKYLAFKYNLKIFSLNNFIFVFLYGSRHPIFILIRIMLKCKYSC